MANSHGLFQQYNSRIRLSNENRNILLLVRDTLRKRMKANYLLIPKEVRLQLELHFQSQGSVIMDTIITPSNEDFDLDDGVYFQGPVTEENRPTPDVFHQWVMQAVDKDNEYETVTDKPTCVRVKYKQGFHIDIPIYYADNPECPDLAHTKEGWILSNPVEFIAWFENIAKSGFQKAFIYESLQFAEQYEKWLSDIRKKDCQIRRIVRYMKAWADLDRVAMPCGIVMTILVANNLHTDERDDIAFRNTLINIRRYLQGNGIKCPRPTSPEGEDLLEKTPSKDKDHFMAELDLLIETANEAIASKNDREASLLWRSVLGSRFPVIPQQITPIQPTVTKQPNLDALKRTAEQSTPWLKEI